MRVLWARWNGAFAVGTSSAELVSGAGSAAGWLGTAAADVSASSL